MVDLLICLVLDRCHDTEPGMASVSPASIAGSLSFSWYICGRRSAQNHVKLIPVNQPGKISQPITVWPHAKKSDCTLEHVLFPAWLLKEVSSETAFICQRPFVSGHHNSRGWKKIRSSRPSVFLPITLCQGHGGLSYHHVLFNKPEPEKLSPYWMNFCILWHRTRAVCSY